ncbi:MAG: Hsp33 family molecular chaperone HslO [Verrucomicrobiota bacterium]
MGEDKASEDRGLEVRTYFVRKRNALLARANFEKLYVDYYLHLADNSLRYEAKHDQIFKEALAAMCLHSASRPQIEVSAWTLNFQDPLINIFVTGDNQQNLVIGQIFTKDVKPGKENLFYSEVVRGDNAVQRSVTAFEGQLPFRAAEHFYYQSEQRHARFFEYDDEDFVLISAQPDCDTEWLMGLDKEAIRVLDQNEELSLLEKRYFRWFCGCNQDNMMKLLVPTMKANPESLFEGEETIHIHCPRCGAKFTISREMLEAFMAEKDSD